MVSTVRSTPAGDAQQPDYDPTLPPRQVLQPADARVLDPRVATCVDGVVPRATAYVGTRVVIPRLAAHDDLIDKLRAAADELGWNLTAEDELDDFDAEAADCLCRTEDGFLGVTVAQISVRPGRAAQAPDAWRLVQQARGKYGTDEVNGAGLDHVINVAPFQSGNPVAPSPFQSGNPVAPSPFQSGNPVSPANESATSYAVASYAQAGSGGRQPVAFAGPAPYRRDDEAIEGRRPVVAVVDTGCGEHPWLERVVRRDVALDGHPIGDQSAATDPERHPDQTGPRDGALDSHAGHGTFVAGLVHQACPDAQILSWRAVSSAGVIVESAWIRTLSQIAELVRRHARGHPGGHPVDVLNLSMGYYHETPEDLLFDPTLRRVLNVLTEHGTTVVCSAGNDATARPFYPAAFAPWQEGRPAEPDRVPVVSVGALNPNAASMAMFSNSGPWVRCFAPGASVLSTVPAMQGGREPYARIEVDERDSETIDPDDYRGGFALWSGTSFAAPVVAGQIASRLLGHLPSREDSPADAVARSSKAVQEVTGISVPQP